MEKNYRVVFTGKSKVELHECEIPKPAANEVLLKNIVTQISTGTELTRLEQNVTEDSYWSEMGDYMSFPVNPGYSSVGEIIAVGEGIDPALIGKKISGAKNHEKYVTLNITDPGVVWEFLPENVDPDDAVFQTLAVVSMASIRSSQVKPGETAVVFGAGIVGQLVARLAKIAGAINVIVADVSDNRLSFLPKNSSFIPVNSGKEDIVKVVEKVTGGNMADIVYETTAYHPLVPTELKCLTKRGKLIVTSSPKGVSAVDLHYCSVKGITIIGAHNHAFHPPVGSYDNPWTRMRDAHYFIQLLEKEEMSLKHMVTHKKSFKEAVALYDMLMKDRTQALAVHIDWRAE